MIEHICGADITSKHFQIATPHDGSRIGVDFAVRVWMDGYAMMGTTCVWPKLMPLQTLYIRAAGISIECTARLCNVFANRTSAMTGLVGRLRSADEMRI